MNEQLLKEAINYFKKDEVYKKLFTKFYKKYESIGHFGGRISLNSFSEKEKEKLKGFINIKLDAKSIAWKAMEEGLKNSKFEKLSWEDIIENCLGKKLISKKELEQKRQEEKESFFANIIEKNKENIGIKWFEETIKQKKNVYFSIIQRYNADREKLSRNLEFFFTGLCLLPIFKDDGIEETLPIFATNVTGNPHSYDEGSFLEKLLLSFLENYYDFTKEEEESPSEYKSRILERVSIIKDELSNDVLIYGIRALDINNNYHSGVEGFYILQEPLKLSIYNLGKIKKLFAQEERVYIIENPAVFLEFIKRHPQKTALCGNGQIRRAVLIAIELFTEDTVFYYSGDFDPEGLLIADKLKKRYKQRLKFWKYDVEIYRNHMSDVVLDKFRLKKLELLESEELKDISREILKYKRALYQEQILEYLT